MSRLRLPSLREPVYIAGPMTGLPGRNYDAFRDFETLLRKSGVQEIENPVHEDDDPEDSKHPWDWYMRRAIVQVAKSRSIVMLNGWTYSSGAMLEFQIASALKLDIYFETEFMP